MRRGKYPTSRAGWGAFYWERYDKTGSRQALHLALWYEVLHLALDDE